MKFINKKGTILLAVLLLVNITFAGCNYYLAFTHKATSDNASQQSSSTVSKNDSEYRNTEYKMFYGEWEIKRIIGSHLTIPVDTEQSKKLIGKKIKYSMEEASFDGKVENDNPKYDIAVIALTTDMTYIDKMPTTSAIGLTGKYFDFVVVNASGQYSSYFPGAEFYVKDEDTLIIFHDSVYYEAVRLSYLDDSKYDRVGRIF